MEQRLKERLEKLQDGTRKKEKRKMFKQLEEKNQILQKKLAELKEAMDVEMCDLL